MTGVTPGQGAEVLEYGFYDDCMAECFKRFGALQDLPVIKDPYTKVGEIYRGGNVLDLGAGKAKPVQSSLGLSDELYFSVDTDPQGAFDYASVAEIPASQSFALAIANQVFEHLTLEAGIALARGISAHLEPGACLVATVPNASHPVRQRSNVTHITPWEYKALYMLCRYAGLEVIEIARYGKRHPTGWVERILAGYVNRIYRIDWCDSILIMGKK